MVLKVQPRPKNMNPKTSISAFIIISICDCVRGIYGCKIIERPLTPPVAKWLGDLKKYTPAANASAPAFNKVQYLTCSNIFFLSAITQNTAAVRPKYFSLGYIISYIFRQCNCYRAVLFRRAKIIGADPYKKRPRLRSYAAIIFSGLA